MRETLKSLSIFSASLLLLLVIASGCVVNIPGCGKRSLPLFKKIQETQTLQTPPSATAAPLESPIETSPSPVAAVPTVSKEIVFEPAVTPSPQAAARAVAVPPTPTPTSTPWETERIAYTTEEKGLFILWTMNPDGTGRIRHTPLSSSAHWPLWSPNGKLLAYLSDQVEGKLNLFVMRKEDQNVQQLTFLDDLKLPATRSLKPPLTWSPRSDQVAFLYKGQVWIVDIASPGQVQSLAAMDPLHSIVALEWAPRRDNKYVAFLNEEGKSHYSLWLVNPRLKDMARIAVLSSEVSSFDWVQDANNVAYVIDSKDVYQCTYESFVQQPLLRNAAEEVGPFIAHSPVETSNQYLLLVKTKGDRLWRVAVAASGKDGKNTITPLTEEGATYAVWSPDGARIAYLQDGELWSMDADGKNKKRTAAGGILQPAWSRK